MTSNDTISATTTIVLTDDQLERVQRALINYNIRGLLEEAQEKFEKLGQIGPWAPGDGNDALACVTDLRNELDTLDTIGWPAVTETYS